MLVSKISFVALAAYLYRLGGGDIFPFKRGYKWVRRFLLPALIFIFFRDDFRGAISMCVLSLVLTFNLDEIEEKDWDDVATYGLAQSWCLYPFAGVWSGLVGAWWLSGVLLSNVGLFGWKMRWNEVELIHGMVIGLVCVVGL